MTGNTSVDNKERSLIREKLEAISQDHVIDRKLHILWRNKLPNISMYKNIDGEKFEEWLAKVKQTYQWLPEHELNWDDVRTLEGGDSLYLLHLQQGITIRFDRDRGKLFLNYDHESNMETVELFKREIKELKKQKTNCKIGFLLATVNGLYVKFKTFTPYEEDLTEYLGTDIERLRTQMVSSIKDQNEGGLFLLHGEPGTGKTSFIKTILSQVDKKAIFITPGLVNHLTSPELIGELMNHPGSTLIIEDAETALMKRQADNTNAVSNLLNLTDGFPADFLKLNIICTFNTRLDDIDPALLREGRLKGIQEFTKLSVSNARDLAFHLGKEIEISSPKTLAEVCNAGSLKKKMKVNGIGFAK